MREKNLYKKKIVWDGDSICAGSVKYGNWATRICARNKMEFKNYAVGGGTVTEEVWSQRWQKNRHSVSATLDTMYAENPDADFIIFEGGTNDADLLGLAVEPGQETRLGSFEENNYSGEYNVKTFCGALESVFYRATKYWHGKKIGYIVAQKMFACTIPEYNNRRLYFDHAVAICKKWGIPCLDLWHGCYLNPMLPWMHDATKTSDENKEINTGYYSDGQHLTPRGYDFTSEIIENWLKTL